MNLYNKGILRLHSVNNEQISEIELKYKNSSRKCADDDQNKRMASCGDLWSIKSVLKKCSTQLSDEDIADCSVKIFEKLMDDLDFKDFTKLVGEENFYVYGSIDGFREKSEILNDTIYSSTLGKIGNKQWDGPLDVVRELLGLSGGEFGGGWIRKGL